MLNSRRLFHRFSVAALIAVLVTSFGAVSTKAWDKADPAVTIASRYSWGGVSATDSAGNTYQVVPFTVQLTIGNISASAPDTDRWAIVKYDSSGDVVWISVPSNASLPVAAIDVDASGNVLLAGDYHLEEQFGSFTLPAPVGENTDAWVGKMNSSGTMLWAKQIGGVNRQWVGGVGSDSAGNVYVSGGFQTTTTFGAAGSLTSEGNNDLFLAKLNSSGTFQWATSIGGTGDDNSGWMENLAVDSAGNSYVTGQIDDSTSAIKIGGNATSLVSNGSLDSLVAKFNSSGQLQWTATGGSAAEDNVYGVGLDSSNNVFIAGRLQADATYGAHTATHISNGGDDGFVAKLNSSGTWQWIRTFGGSGDEGPAALTIDSSGNPIISGWYTSSNFQIGTTTHTFGAEWNGFVAKMNTSGTWQWSKTVVSQKDSELYGVGTDSSGNIYVSGYISGPSAITFSGSSAFNYATGCTAGGECASAILWKLSPTGGVPTATTSTTTSTTSTTTTVANSNTTTTVPSTGSTSDSSQSTTGSTKSATNKTKDTVATTGSSEAPQAAEPMTKINTAKAPKAIEVATGSFTAEIAGKKVSTVVRRESNQVHLSVGGIEITVSGQNANGERIALNSSGNLSVTNDDKINISISGVQPNTEINSWIFSDPTLLGALKVSADGKAESTFEVPANIANGSHTLTFEAKTATGESADLRYGVEIGGGSGGSSAIPALLISIILLAVLSAIFLPAAIKRRKKAEIA